MKLIYDIESKPPIGKSILFAFQQMIAIMPATLLVPMLMSGMKTPGGASLVFDPAAALFGAGIGTIVYLLFTKRKSPVFLGSSFTFLGAYEAVIGQNYGYWGVIIGICFAGLVYVAIALIVKAVGSGWVNKLLPAVIIGPIVALIGLSLSGTATSWVMSNGGSHYIEAIDPNGVTYQTLVSDYNLLSILCALVTFIVIVLASVKGGKTMKLIPFIIGIGAGYLLALIFTVIGKIANVEYMQLLNFQPFIDTFGDFRFTSIFDYPKFTFLKAIQSGGEYPIDGVAVANIAIIFIPIGIVELAQHIADHKNLSSIVDRDLISNPGLDKTLLGDGIGSIVGGFFGGAANTTYGESIGCVAITKNASIVTILYAALGCMLLSFFTPFVTVINSIPKCVMGGACIALYGFIAVSGLQMLKQVDLNDSKNLFVVSAILVIGIGGLTLDFGFNKLTGGPLFQITALATALIVGLLTNLLVHIGNHKDQNSSEDLLSESVGDEEMLNESEKQE